ncbi:hypothetical protein DFH28DRAFT_63202 [Melampsora americana]|nr:hypothetical protein DFH28DRAFT_63202 [Melampsora americana]
MTTPNHESNTKMRIDSIINQPKPLNQTSSSSSSSFIELILKSKEDSSERDELELLKKSKVEEMFCLPEKEDCKDVLDERLDPSVHGIGYFLILSMRLEYGKFMSSEKMMNHLTKFCLEVKRSQLLKLSIDLIGFVKNLIEFTSQSNSLSSSIELIFCLISRFDEPELLTALHFQLMKVSLFTRQYKRAIELSNVDLIKVNRKNHPIDYQDHLLYHYFAGIIQALNKNYKRSIQLLTITVSAPGSFISQIQIEAYKKLILINLLIHSKSSPHLPKYLNSQFKHQFLKMNQVYLDLMNQFLNLIKLNFNLQFQFEIEKLLKFVEKNSNQFLQDRNYGLVKLCIEVLPRRKIMNLIPIYKSIPIKTINSILNQSSILKTQELIKSMIENREIYAKLQSNEEVLDFLDPPEEEMMDLNLMVKKIKGFESQMREIEALIERDPEYLKKTLKELKEMEKPMGGTGPVPLGGSSETHVGLVQQHQQMQLVPAGEEDLGVGFENGWDEQDSFK